jgi:hypothetical protein
MSTLELEHLKHTSSSTNNLSVHSDGSLTLGNLTNLNVNGRFQVGDSSITQAYPTAGYVLDVQASSGNQSYISIAEPGTSSLGDNGMIIGEDTTHSWIVQRGNKGMNFSTNDLGRLLINANGCVTTPYQPAFTATGFSAHRYMNTWNNVALDDWLVVEQSSANAFNNSNGRFTAPINGMYFFIYTSMFTNPSTNDFHNMLKKNGSGYAYSNNHSGGGSGNGHQWNDCTVSAAMSLSAGDYVTAASTGSSSSTCYLYGTGGSRYSNFSGYLIG